MSEFYETENPCVRCLRSSPIASLLGFIAVLIGGGAFGGATIFARRYLIALLDAPNLLPYLDFAVYGLVGAIGLFSLIAYIVCALSSGWNAKHCFESSRKSACGRCCNMTLIVSLVLAIAIWSVVACLMCYPVMSIALLWYRNEGATRLRLASLDLPGTTGHSGVVSFEFPSQRRSLDIRSVRSPSHFPKHASQQRQEPEMVGYPIPGNTGEPPERISFYGDRVPAQIDPWSKMESNVGTLQDMTHDHEPDSYDHTGMGQTVTEVLHKVGNQIQSSGTDLAKNLSDVVASSLDESKNRAVAASKDFGQRVINKALSASESVSVFFKCSADFIDLSYYGLYDAQGLPIYVARNNLETRTENILVCVCIAISGIFLLILGYLQILICTAMNYARLQESRYYEASSEVGEEGVALQQ
ncbi:hypothetical protein D915_001529 [Fasciola hepatica]|uniref:Uncharacterized protein n=1 Tax=Fasciola hepatica TaxID=6192 RepID=A0A4E0RIA4_FASHE|nr:hypothetical protein D915_001529 [Fasciola hepatica]